MLTPNPSIKKPEFILSVDVSQVELVPVRLDLQYHLDMDAVIAEMVPFVAIRQRDWLDNCKNSESPINGDTRYRQVLPYVIVRDKGNGNVVKYQRLSGSGEQRLVSEGTQFSIGFGGHIDAADVRWNGSEIDMQATIKSCMHKELLEEIGVDIQGATVEAEGIICSESENGVDQLHIALVYSVYIDVGDINKNAEIDQIAVHPETLSLKDMRVAVDDGNLKFESWSEKIIKSLG